MSYSIERVNACCEAFFASQVPAIRAAAATELKSILVRQATIPADVPTTEAVQVLAGLPASLPFMLALLRDPSSSVWTCTFAAGEVTYCVDNFWNHLDQDERFTTRTELLSWLAARGLEAPSWARGSAVTALARMTTLGWRQDSRHHQTPEHVLQFLAPGRDPRHIELGLELVTRMTEDQCRPHAVLPDSTRPTVRLLLYRDLALRPFVTRMIGLLQELLGSMCQNASLALQAAPPAGLDAASLSATCSLASKVCEALHSVLTGFRWGLDAAPGAGMTSEDSSGEEGDADGDVSDAAAINLPASWDAFRTHGPSMTASLWVRLALQLYHITLTYRSQAHPIWSNAELASTVARLGPATLGLLGDLGSCKTPFHVDEDHRARRALYMRALIPCLLYCVACPAAARQHLKDSGYMHALARSVFRSKLTIALVYVCTMPDESYLFLSCLAVFTYAAYARHPLLVGQGGSGTAPPPWHEDRSATGYPAGTALLLMSPSSIPACACPENTLYYLRSAWLLLLIPASLLGMDESPAHSLRSVAKPLLEAMLNRYVPLNDSPYVADDDDDENVDVDAGAANITEQVDDDTVELAAELGRFCAPTAAREVASRIRACTSAIMGLGSALSSPGAPSSRGSLSPQDTARKQKQLAWLVRFSAILGTAALTPSAQDDLEVGIVDPEEQFGSTDATQRSDPRMPSLLFGEHWTHPTVSLDPQAALLACVRMLERGFEQQLMAPLLAEFQLPPYLQAAFAVPGQVQGQGAGADEGITGLDIDADQPSYSARMSKALNADVAVTGQMPAAVGGKGMDEATGSSADMGLTSALAGRSPMGAAAPPWTNLAPARMVMRDGKMTIERTAGAPATGGTAADDDEFLDEDDEEQGFGPRTSPISQDHDGQAGRSRSRGSVYKGMHPEAALLAWYEKGQNGHGMFTSIEDTEEDDAVSTLLASFRVNLAREHRYCAMLALPVQAQPVITEAELRVARLVRMNSVAALDPASSLRLNTPEQIAAELAAAVLRASLLLKMRNTLARVSAGSKLGLAALSAGPAASSSVEVGMDGIGSPTSLPSFARARLGGAGMGSGLGMSSPSSLEGSLSMSMVGTPGLGASAARNGVGGGSADDSEDGSSGVGEDDDKALAAELDAVGSRLLRNLQVGEGGAVAAGSTASAFGTPAPARPSGAASILSGILSAPGATPVGAQRGAPAPSAVSAPFATTRPSDTSRPSTWTAASVSLEVALLSFFTAFHMWYARYRAAAGAVLAIRESFAQRGILDDPNFNDMPMLLPTEAGAPLGSRTSSDERGGFVSAGAVPDTRGGIASDLGMAEEEGSAAGASHGVAAASSASRALASWVENGQAGALTTAEVKQRLQAETRRNVLLLVADFMGAQSPIEVLDMVVAKVLDNCRGAADTPPSLLSASLECLHDLALGVTMVVGNTAGSALLSGQGGAAVQTNGAMWSNSGTARAPALPDAVTIGDDLLQTVCVKALLRKPFMLLFPPLRLPSNAKLRTLLYGTLTRLLFMHARAVTAPLAMMLRAVPEESGTGEGGGRQKTEAAELVFADPDGGVHGWFRTFMQHLAGVVDECRSTLGMGKIGGSLYAGEASYILQAIEGDLQAAARGGPTASSVTTDPRAKIVRPVLIGLLRDLRGVVSATQTPSELRVVHDWMAGAGVHALLVRVAQVWQGRASSDVVIPLLRLIAELASSRGSRLVFPPDNASGFILCRCLARAVTAIATQTLIEAQTGRGAIGAGGGKHGQSAVNSGVRLSHTSWDVKVGTAILLCGCRVLGSRACNMAIPSAYGDTSLPDLAHACLSMLLALPLPIITSRRKTLSVSMSACFVLVAWPCPPPMVPLHSVLQESSSQGHAAVQGDPSKNLPQLLVVSRDIGIGLPPSVSSSMALSSLSVQSPLAVLALLRLPTPMVAGFLARCTAGLDRKIAGSEGYMSACEALEAILTVETDARMLVRLSQDPSSSLHRSPPGKLHACPSRVSMSLAVAEEVLARMDKHTAAPASVYASGLRSGDYASALGSGALDKERIIAISSHLDDTPWGTGDAAAAQGAARSHPSQYLDGVLGLDFMTSALLTAVRETAAGSLHAWTLGRVVLLAMLCRPSSFGAAGSGIIALASEDWRDTIAEGIGDLAGLAETLEEPTSNESKDAFASAFVRWARSAGGRV